MAGNNGRRSLLVSFRFFLLGKTCLLFLCFFFIIVNIIIVLVYLKQNIGLLLGKRSQTLLFFLVCVREHRVESLLFFFLFIFIIVNI